MSRAVEGRLALLLLAAAALGGAGSRSVARPEAVLWLGGDLHVGARAPGAVIAGMDAAPLVVNLEGPVTTAGGAGAWQEEGGRIRLGNAADALPALRAAGVVAAGIANNHARDAGSPEETARALRRAGILPFGDAAGAAILERNGMRIALTAHDLSEGVPSELANELRSARGSGDVLVASFHVTAPATYLPIPALRQAVSIALAEGASVVTAHGTHAIGPVERRGDAVIAWGLGNLLFACDCTHESDAILLEVRVSGKGPVRARAVPIEAGLRGEPSRRAPDEGILDLLEAIGSSPGRREAGTFVF